ncbi:MAG: PAS domain-containing protein, partial [Deltaproteobacteria bacterium]
MSSIEKPSHENASLSPADHGGGQSLLEELPVPAFTTTAAGLVSSWNALMEQITGVQSKDVMGKKAWTAFFDAKRSTPVDAALRVDEDIMEEDFPVVHRESGKETRVRFAVHPLRNGGEEPVGTVATLVEGGSTREVTTMVAAMRSVMQAHRTGDAGAVIPTDGLAGPWREIAESFNHVTATNVANTKALGSLQKELQRLTEASKEGQLSERGKPEQFQGAYAEIIAGVNVMLDAILLPI